MPWTEMHRRQEVPFAVLSMWRVRNRTRFLESVTRGGLAMGGAKSVTGFMGREVFQKESNFPFPSSSPPEREGKVRRVQRTGWIWLRVATQTDKSRDR